MLDLVYLDEVHYIEKTCFSKLTRHHIMNVIIITIYTG